MLYRQINASQVKCNFCMEWMSLSINIKFSISICDSCLNKGCQDSTLKAVSSTGETYQLYIVKQNSVIDLSKHSNTMENWFQDHQQNKFYEKAEANIKKQLLEEMDYARNSEIKDIMRKWSDISSLLQEKDYLSEDETNYFRNLISQEETKFNQFNGQLIPFQNLNTFTNLQQSFNFLIKEQQVVFDQINILPSSSKNDFPQISLGIQNKQNSPLRVRNSSQNKQNESELQVMSVYRSPSNFPPKQKDLNTLHLSLNNIFDLKVNNFTPEKRLRTSFFDQNIYQRSSFVKSQIHYHPNQPRSSSKGSQFSSIKKRLNTEQDIKHEHTKSKISEFLQRYYKSQCQARLVLTLVLKAYENTRIAGKSFQLISYNLSETDFRCYLEAFDWTGIEVLKLVKTSLCDDQLRILLYFIAFNKLQIKVLVLTGNNLSEASIQHLYDQDLSSIKQIYLGKNRILKGKVRAKIVVLQNKYSLYL